MTRLRDIGFVLAVAAGAAIIGMLVVACVGVAHAETYQQCLEKAQRQYERRVGQCRDEHPMPSVTPSRSPAPTVTPRPTRSPGKIPCEGLGNKTFEIGVPRLLCWKETIPRTRPMVFFQSRETGNFACSTYELYAYRPDGSWAYEPNAGGAPQWVTPWAGAGEYAVMLTRTGGACPGLFTEVNWP